jgi:phytoene/squalene synthetase
MLASGRWAVLSGLEVYRSILNGIRRNDYDVFTRRAGASGWGKLRLSLRAFWQVQFQRPIAQAEP